MRPSDRQRILLGVTSGIASYRAASLARRLTQPRAEVDVLLARAALDFIGACSCEALNRRPVRAALIAPGRARGHIALARAAQLVIVIPVTAGFCACAVDGHDDDLLSACLRTTKAPALLVPAINDPIRAHPHVRRKARAPRSVGYRVLDPDNGALAVGAGSGPGRVLEPATNEEYWARLLERPAELEGSAVVVTAELAREPINTIRFRSNHSSEKMGAASAFEASRRSAEVTKSMAAAPADFSAAAPANIKIKKSLAASSFALLRTDDILVTTRAARSTSCATIGFAQETGDARAEAHGKLADDRLNLIVASDALENGAGFAVNTNRVTIAHEDGREEGLPFQSKTQVADEILDRVEVLTHGR